MLEFIYESLPLKPRTLVQKPVILVKHKNGFTNILFSICFRRFSAPGSVLVEGLVAQAQSFKHGLLGANSGKKGGEQRRGEGSENLLGRKMGS